MKKTLFIAICTVLLFPAVAYSDDAEPDEVLRRAKTLEGMTFKAGQLKLQSQMAESYKKMEDAGFIVGEDGAPIGVKDINQLGEEVRRQGGKQEESPFHEENPVVPREAIFGTQELPTLSGDVGTKRQDVQDDEEDKPDYMRLKEIRADSVVIVTRDGPHELRNGQSVNGHKLTRFSIDKAFLVGPSGTRVLGIDWASRQER